MSTTGRVNRTRDGKGRFRQDLEHAHRDAQAAEMIAGGATYDQVAAEFGYADRGAAWRAVNAVMVRTARGTRTEEYRVRSVAEMEALKSAMWRTVISPPVLADRLGRPVHDDDGQVVLDEQARSTAAQVIIRASERIARLRGLDAPRKSVSVLAEIPTADIAAYVEELRATLGIPGDDGLAARAAIAGTVEPSGDAA